MLCLCPLKNKSRNNHYYKNGFIQLENLVKKDPKKVGVKKTILSVDKLIWTMLSAKAFEVCKSFYRCLTLKTHSHNKWGLKLWNYGWEWKNDGAFKGIQGKWERRIHLLQLLFSWIFSMGGLLIVIMVLINCMLQVL